MDWFFALTLGFILGAPVKWVLVGGGIGVLIGVATAPIKSDAKGHILGAVLFVLAAAGWITSIVACVSENRLGLLIVNLSLFPVGVVHGWGIWLGVWH
jgi:hypothetical protein